MNDPEKFSVLAKGERKANPCQSSCVERKTHARKDHSISITGDFFLSLFFCPKFLDLHGQDHAKLDKAII